MRTPRLFLAAACLATVHAHICLISPQQRGGFNVSDPGDYTCFQPAAPCGSKASAAPAMSYVGGQTVDIVFQQNLNHYNPGHPGFLDVAWAPFPEPPTDDNFTILATIPDYWAHLQAAQTNFTVSVTLPDVAIDHAVLRVRYHPNKPTEPIFHQCADIAITANTQPPASLGLFAQVNARLQPASASIGGELVSIAPNGTWARAADSFQSYGIIPVEGMSTAVAGKLFSVALYAADAASDAPAAALVTYSAADQTINVLNITLPDGDANPPSQWTAISAAPQWLSPSSGGQPLVLLGLAQASPGTWTYQARLLDPISGAAGPILAASIPTDTYVNFFQATNVFPSGGNTGVMYFLAGDENTLTGLDALVYTVTLDPSGSDGVSNMTAVQQDITAFTLSGMTLNPVDGSVYAVSPGLFGGTHYSLVSVDPATGAVTSVGAINFDGLAFWYGGNVYGDAINDAGELFHVFRRALDDSMVLMQVSVQTAAVTTSPTLLTGVNNELVLSSVTRVG